MRGRFGKGGPLKAIGSGVVVLLLSACATAGALFRDQPGLRQVGFPGSPALICRQIRGTGLNASASGGSP